MMQAPSQKWQDDDNATQPINIEEALPSIEDAATLLSQPIVLPPDVIDGILHLGGKLVLGGASKSYKSWLLIDVAVSVASGSIWLNFTTKKGRVLYVNFELPRPFLTRRIQTVCEERQLRLEPGMLDLWNLRGHVAKWSQLQAQFPMGVYALIIFDPSYKILLDRDENRTGDILRLMNDFEMIAVRTGAAVAFGSHHSKGDQSKKEAIDRISGSGVWTRDPDSIVNFSPQENFVKYENECYSVDLTLRSHPPQKSFVVRWEFPLFVTDSTLDPARLKQAGRKADESKSAEKVLKLLTKPMFASEWEKAAKARGISRATFYRRVEELENAGKVQLTEDEKWSPVC